MIPGISTYKQNILHKRPYIRPENLFILFFLLLISSIFPSPSKSLIYTIYPLIIPTTIIENYINRYHATDK